MIEAYTIDIPDERLTAIATKVRAYDWDAVADAGGWDAGIGIGDLRRLVDYWQSDFD